MAVEKNPKYKIILFKLKDHQTWRMTTEGHLENIKPEITETKTIWIDRLTGEVKTE